MKKQIFSDEALRKIAQQLLCELQKEKEEVKNDKKIPVGISNRHIHLCQADIEILFGKEAVLEHQKDLGQPGQFAAKQTVTIVGPKNSIHNVRVLGPARNVSQLEISKTDSFQLGIHPPVNESGDLTNAASIFVVGPKGSVFLEKNVIIAKRHIHMSPTEAEKFNVTNGQLVQIRTSGEREIILCNTVIRVRDDFRLECHLDTDEANAAELNTKNSFVEIIQAR
ncbi:phosphate propanoyltransferase [Enterococcus olivae]